MDLRSESGLPHKGRLNEGLDYFEAVIGYILKEVSSKQSLAVNLVIV